MDQGSEQGNVMEPLLLGLAAGAVAGAALAILFGPRSRKARRNKFADLSRMVRGGFDDGQWVTYVPS